MQGYVDAALERFGRIDCFFDNAGVEGVVSPFLDYPEDVYDRVMAVNAKGVWLGLKHVGAARPRPYVPRPEATLTKVSRLLEDKTS